MHEGLKVITRLGRRLDGLKGGEMAVEWSYKLYSLFEKTHERRQTSGPRAGIKSKSIHDVFFAYLDTPEES